MPLERAAAASAEMCSPSRAHSCLSQPVSSSVISSVSCRSPWRGSRWRTSMPGAPAAEALELVALVPGSLRRAPGWHTTARLQCIRPCMGTNM